jgi:hypothetical protein
MTDFTFKRQGFQCLQVWSHLCLSGGYYILWHTLLTDFSLLTDFTVVRYTWWFEPKVLERISTCPERHTQGYFPNPCSKKNIDDYYPLDGLSYFSNRFFSSTCPPIYMQRWHRVGRPISMRCLAVSLPKGIGKPLPQHIWKTNNRPRRRPLPRPDQNSC